MLPTKFRLLNLFYSWLSIFLVYFLYQNDIHIKFYNKLFLLHFFLLRLIDCVAQSIRADFKFIVMDRVFRSHLCAACLRGTYLRLCLVGSKVWILVKIRDDVTEKLCVYDRLMWWKRTEVWIQILDLNTALVSVLWRYLRRYNSRL